MALRLTIPLILFMCDIACLTLFYNDYFHTLAAFTLVGILNQRPSFLILFYLLLLAFFSSLTTGLLITHLAFLTGFFLLAKSISYYSTQKLIIASVTIALITVVPQAYAPHVYPYWPAYTILATAVNLVVVYFSLKWSPAVKRGNRS